MNGRSIVIVIVAAVALICPIHHSTAAMACGPLTYHWYNSISWEDLTFSAMSNVAQTVLTSDFAYSPANGVSNNLNAVTGNNNYHTTTSYLEYIKTCNVAAVAAHGLTKWIVVEYFSNTALLRQSAIDQGFCTVDEIADGSCTNYGRAIVRNAAGFEIASGLAAANSWVRAKHVWDADRVLFLNFACEGVNNGSGYAGNLEAETFCLVGPTVIVGAATINTQFTTLLHNMSCSLVDELLETVEAALLAENMQGTYLDYVGNGGLTLSTCSSCSIDGTGVSDLPLASSGLTHDAFFWYARRPLVVDAYKIFGLSGSSWILVDTQLASAYADSSWFGVRSHDTSHENFDAYYMEAVRGVDLIGRSEPVFTEAGIANLVATSTRSNSVDDPTTDFSQLLLTSEPDVVIVAQHVEDSLGLNIEDLCAFYTDQGLGVAVISDSNYLEFADIRSQYASLHDTARSPLLVLCGPAPIHAVDPRHLLSVPQGQFSDDCSGCAMGSPSYCYGDWDYTDVDFDGVPDGPITRIPVINQAALDDWVSRAEEFNAGVDIDASRHIALVSGDLSDKRFNSELQSIGNAYRSIGYSALPLVCESTYGSRTYDEDAWNDFGAVLDSGVLEMWAAGSATGPTTWTGVLMYPSFSVFPSWSSSLVRTQGIIVWAPTCQTTFRRIHDTGYEERNLGYDFFGSATSHAVALVGHNMGGWGTHHKLMRSYLLEQRLLAVPGETTVAHIAWQAVRNMIQDYPYLASHVKSLGVWGCNVKIQLPELSDVANETAHAHTVTAINMARGGPGVDVGGAAGENVEIAVYDIRGRVVRQICNATQGSQHAEYLWNGRDANGRTVSSGVYLFRVRVGSETVVRKVVIER